MIEGWGGLSGTDENPESVPPEALTAPNETAAVFDAEAWLEQGRANLDKLPDGVVLPEPKDWATELWHEAYAAFESEDTYSEGHRQAIEALRQALIRERVVLKEGV